MNHVHSETGTPGRQGQKAWEAEEQASAGADNASGSLSYRSGSPSWLSRSLRFLSSGTTDASYLGSRRQMATLRKPPSYGLVQGRLGVNPG